MQVNVLVPELKFVMTVKQTAPLLGETVNRVEEKVLDDDSPEKIAWEFECLHMHMERNIQVDVSLQDKTAIVKSRTQSWAYEYTLQPILVIGARRFLLGREV